MSRRTVKLEGPHFVDIHVGHRIKLRRAELGISQSTLAERLGITFQQIQKYERGTNRVSASMLYQAAGALSVSVGYFFEDLPGGDGEGSQVSLPETFYLAASPKGHRLLHAILALPAPIQSKITSLINAIGNRESGDEESDSKK